MSEPQPASPELPPRWAKVIDQTRCIGCHACSTACKSENQVPLGVHRTYVKYADVGAYPRAHRAFQVTRCNQCEDAPCVAICPTEAMHTRADGLVDFDKSVCIGCKACMAACPYDAVFINPDDGFAEKCNFCAHRLDVGLEPACVIVCPTRAIEVGDMNDPGSPVARAVGSEALAVRRPEKATRPKLFYRGASEATLDPLAAERPEGGLFLWSEQAPAPARPPGPGTSSAAAVLSYDVGHEAPWDWRVSLYTWTKGIGAGAYLVAALLVLFGLLGGESPLWLWAAPVVSAAFVGLTGLILIFDLEHPERFYLVFTRAHLSSWLVRGAFVIGAFSLVLGVHVLASLLGAGSLQAPLAAAGLPLAAATAIYTAYLFAQAKGRDLWQSPLLAPHLLAQAVLCGAAALMPLAAWLAPGAGGPLAWFLAGGTAAHLLFVAGELTVPHPTAHARLAARGMTRGAHRGFFWGGLALSALGLAAPWLGAAASLPALAGLLAHEHAYVQSGQSVPLA